MKTRLSSVRNLLALVCLLMSSQAFSQTPPCNTQAPKSYTITATSTGEIYIPDASSRPWKGGDTLKIQAGNYSLIELSNFSGDPCKPIIITNSGGLVTATTWRMRNNTRYFRITGTGKPGLEYGIKINGGMMAITLAHHFEVDHVEATGGSLGFYFKTVPVTSDPRTIYTAGSSSNYVMTDVKIHHNYLHDIAGEGMYIGHTGPSGNQEGTGLVPLRMNNVEIAYNTVVNVDWDGIQLSNARDNASIHDNIVWNFGRINKGSQQAGIILGGNTNGSIYNNHVSKGTGNGIQVFGYGRINVYNNTIDSTGWDGTANGQESFYSTDAQTNPESNPKQEIRFYNNIVKNPKPKGAVRVGAYSNYSLPSTITNNQFCIPNAASNWQTFHVVTNVAGSTLSNNVLSCGGSTPPPPVNQLPVARAGADITITLPVATATLNGSGTDSDGSIVSYAWTKISGPATGTILASLSATTGLAALVQGTYKYELKVTDNNGGVGRDTVQVTVNPLAVVIPPPTSGGGDWIRVNLSNTTSISNAAWNNWNVNSSLNSPALKNEAGASTSVKATLNSQAMLIDNGTGYATSSTTPPSDVLRFNSASTSQREMYFTGLKANQAYSLEFYGSRKSTGNKTVVSVGNVKDTINTDNNASDVARLDNIKADGSGKITVIIARIGTWNYIAGFAIAEANTSGDAPAGSVSANAGSDKTITLPTSSVSLQGAATASGTTVSSYSWSMVSGPATAGISNATSATATATGLALGTYTFQLKVTGANGTTSTDNVNVTVNGSSQSPGRNIRVNVFNGSVTHDATRWNNWNSASVSSALKYEDGATSTVKVAIAGQAGVADNGTSYATSATTPPSGVLRYNSYSTSTRVITVTGLKPGSLYGFEFYGSRKSTGNKSVFTIGNIKDTVNTDNNASDYAQFDNITADGSGKVEIEISRIGTYNYLAGLTIIEQSGAVAVRGGEDIMSSATSSISNDISASVKVFPNPFVSTLNVELDGSITGQYTINLLDMSGKQLLTKQGTKTNGSKTESLNVSNITFGYYIVQVVSSAGQASVKVKKIGASEY